MLFVLDLAVAPPIANGEAFVLRCASVVLSRLAQIGSVLSTEPNGLASERQYSQDDVNDTAHIPLQRCRVGAVQKLALRPSDLA